MNISSFLRQAFHPSNLECKHFSTRTHERIHVSVHISWAATKFLYKFFNSIYAADLLLLQFSLDDDDNSKMTRIIQSFVLRFHSLHSINGETTERLLTSYIAVAVAELVCHVPMSSFKLENWLTCDSAVATFKTIIPTHIEAKRVNIVPVLTTSRSFTVT